MVGMEQLELSVVIAIYNADKYLRACLESVRACPAENMECILVNDGSSDGTKNICEEFVQADRRFCLINKGNTGVSDSRNKGADKARGRYIFFVDADDYLDASQWAMLLEDARNGRYDMVAYGYYTLYASGETEENGFPIQGEKSDSFETVRRVLLTTPLLNTCWGKLLKREIIEKNRVCFREELKTGEDAIFMIDFVETASTFLLRNRCVLYYRQHQSSAMRRMNIDEKLEDFSELFIRRNAYWELASDKALWVDMYRQFFSVITDLFLQYASRNTFGKTKEAFKDTMEKQMVKDILAQTEYNSLSPVYKKLEYSMLRRGWLAAAAFYFTLKTKLNRR